ncbi:MAG: HU family DNA-binding protein [Legionellales bacterium]|nr:HU family DNA-binding protein [Legionellales bacterium]
MNKSDLVDAIAGETGATKAATANFIDSFVENIISALKKGESVALPGFGTLEVRPRAARTGRNPQTGAEIKIAASHVVRFKPGKKLKETVAGK